MVMEEKSFTWTHDLAERLLEIRFSNDWLFRKYKQPWHQFHKLLSENGFPEEMTVSHVRKKYGYMYDMYKIAKKSKNKAWPYYELFDRHYSKANITDVKYDSWSNKWRLKLVTLITEAKAQNIDSQIMWRTVEKALRSMELPIDCCIQDLKGLWHHITVTFNRKHRLNSKKTTKVDWTLYSPLLEYFQTHEPEYMKRLETELPVYGATKKRIDNHCFSKDSEVVAGDDDEFQWNKHSTESFIQIRLQHDWMFRERKWAWNDLAAIMIKEYGFPKSINGRDISKKWSSTFADYQKAKATNNKSWIWYTLFEVYMGDSFGKLDSDPLLGWQEEWILNLISVRTELDFLFVDKDLRKTAWREVEKRLRIMGVPVDHSLLELSAMWTHLLKTFFWKDKFAKKGLLTEQWPYYDALTNYDKNKVSREMEFKDKPVKSQGADDYEQFDDFDDDDDDMKLLDLKQKLGLMKPKVELLEVNSCRSCAGDVGCVNVFEHRDRDGYSLADKMKIIADVQVDPSDGLPSQICLTCLRDLENAYKYRRKCQEVDKTYRSNEHKIKLEIEPLNPNNELDNQECDQTFDTHIAHDSDHEIENKIKIKAHVKRKPQKVRKKKEKKGKYVYVQMCEICGKTTKNLKHHVDMHSTGKMYECEQCGRKFKYRGGLIVHRAVHEETPRKTCEVCGKSFHILAQYKRHFVYHANERKFSCETCGKRFNTIDILKVHARMHTDERPFSCSECGKSFRTAGCVSRHKRIVHKTGKTQLMG